MEIGVLFTRIGVSGLYQHPRLRPCGQRRVRSGRLGNHGHRAPSLPSVRMAASQLATSDTFHWTNNQITHKVRCTNTSFLFPCPNKSAAGVICNKPVEPQQHHCHGCRNGGGADRRQRSSSCFPLCFFGFPIAHLSFVCFSHGGGSLSPFWQVQSKVVDSGLDSQLRPSHRRWIAQPCPDARFRATAVIREHSHIASTTESASWHTDAVSLFTGPATDWIGSVPACWEQPGAAHYGCLGSVPASRE